MNTTIVSGVDKKDPYYFYPEHLDTDVDQNPEGCWL